MVKNEEYWLPYVLENLCQVFDKIVAIDCGSRDETPEILLYFRSIYHEKIDLELLREMNLEKNGYIRQYMSEKTQTTWAAIIDGDEYYPVAELKKLVDTILPGSARLTYTTLEVVDLVDNDFVIREPWSKQCLFHVPSTTWNGPFPFEVPKPWIDSSDQSTRFYYPDVVGYDLHHLPRSSRDEQTPHRLRKDLIRQVMPVRRAIPELKNEFQKRQWPNPVLEEIYAGRLPV